MVHIFERFLGQAFRSPCLGALCVSALLGWLDAALSWLEQALVRVRLTVTKIIVCIFGGINVLIGIGLILILGLNV